MPTKVDCQCEQVNFNHKHAYDRSMIMTEDIDNAFRFLLNLTALALTRKHFC